MFSLILRAYVTLLALALVGGVQAAQVLPAQTSNHAAVAVKVSPQKLEGAFWDFEVIFDTHSQELTDDLLKTVVLVAADGTQRTPIEWRGDPPGGHHRKGVLRFNAPKPAPQVVDLRISRAGELKPRSFRWDLRR